MIICKNRTMIPTGWGRTLFFFIVFLVNLVPPALADTRYVTDILYVSLRQGPGKDQAVVSVLKSNTPLEVIGETENYLNVRTETGDVGWIPVKYVTTNLPRAVVVEKLNGEIKRLREMIAEKGGENSDSWKELNKQNAEFSERINALTAEKKDLLGKITSLEQKNTELTKEFKTLKKQSGDTKTLRDELSRLKKINAEQKQEIIRMAGELENKGKQGYLKTFLSGGKSWFFAGAIVLIAGIAVGSIVSSRRRTFY